MTEDKSREYARQVLGAALVSKEGRDVLTHLSHIDFAPPEGSTPESLIAEVIRSMDAAGQAVDQVTVAAEMDVRGTLRRIGGSVTLHKIVSELVTAANVDYYAALLRNETRRRMAIAAARQSVIELERGEVSSPDVVWERRQQLESEIPAPLDAAEKDYSLAAFMKSEDSEEKWLIPGLIGRGERVMVTGSEGLGKGVLLRQIAASAASGWNPFGPGKYSPARVLFVDLENPRPVIKQTFFDLGRALNWRYEKVDIHWEPDGIDLLGAGTAWMHQIVGDHAPDIVFISPIYKALGDEDERDGVVISRIIRRLDQIRRRHDVALVIEQHSPNETAGHQRTVRPVGSSIWRRWCDTGVGLRAHDMSQEDEDEQQKSFSWERAEWVDVVRWKPSRGPRDWPRQLRYGARNQVPWVPAGKYRPRGIVA